MRSDCTGPIAGPRAYPYRRHKREAPALELVRNVALARDAGFPHWHRGHSWSSKRALDGRRGGSRLRGPDSCGQEHHHRQRSGGLALLAVRPLTGALRATRFVAVHDRNHSFLTLLIPIG